MLQIFRVSAFETKSETAAGSVVSSQSVSHYSKRDMTPPYNVECVCSSNNCFGLLFLLYSFTIVFFSGSGEHSLIRSCYWRLGCERTRISTPLLKRKGTETSNQILLLVDDKNDLVNYCMDEKMYYYYYKIIKRIVYVDLYIFCSPYRLLKVKMRIDSPVR